MTVLVLDIGSSSTRALLFDEQAQPIPGALVTVPYQMTTEPPGAATLDAETLRAHVESAIDQILRHPAARTIRVAGMDTLVGNALGVDAGNAPLTPVYTYADTRCAEDVAALRTLVDEAESHQRTGCVLHTAYLPARLRWARRTEPVVPQVATWIDVGTYLYRRWFGSAPCSYSVASWSGLLNRTALTWDREWLSTLELSDDQLPDLADYNHCLRGLTPDYAERWPALRDVPFCLAIGDGAAANIGAGCIQPAQIALTVGTTAALRAVVDGPISGIPPGLWCYRVDAQRSLIGGATSEGGNLFQWAQDTFRLDSRPALEAALAERAPDSHGLTVLPFLAGERSPGWANDATGVFAGARLSTTPLDMVQAILEAVAHRLALIADQLQAVTGDDTRIIASGGALDASPVWMQMIANALDHPLERTSETELTARGTAILALQAIGAGALEDYEPTIRDAVQPQRDAVPVMRAARERQVALYNELLDMLGAKTW